jgi:hypothetical protein
MAVIFIMYLNFILFNNILHHAGINYRLVIYLFNKLIWLLFYLVGNWVDKNQLQVIILLGWYASW